MITTRLTAACAVLALTASVASAGNTRRVATLAPQGSPWMQILEQGAADLESATNGRIVIKFYAGGVQGDEKDVVRKMRMGQLDGAALTVVGLSMIYPGIRVLQLPMMFESEDEVYYVRKKMWSHFRKAFAKKGFYLGEAGGAGWEYFYTNRAINGLDDFKKVKMWAWTDDMIVREFFDKVGIRAVPLSVPDLLGALKTGRVDGCYGAPLAAIALQWYNEITHATSVPMAYTVGAAVVRMDVHDKVSAEDQKTEKKIALRMAKAVRKRVKKDNKRSLKAMKKAGVVVVQSPPAMVDTMQSQAEKVWTEMVGKVYSQEELDMVLAYRNEYRAKQASK